MGHNYTDSIKQTRLNAYLPHPYLCRYIKEYDFRINTRENLHNCRMIAMQNATSQLFIHLNNSKILLNYNGQEEYFSAAMVGLFIPDKVVTVIPKVFDDYIKWVVIPFTFAGIHRLFYCNGKAVANKMIQLTDIFGERSKLLQEELYYATNHNICKEILDKFFLQRLLKPVHLKEQRLLVLDEIFKKTNGPVSIEFIADELCMSYRSVERLFEEDVGLNFRRFINIFRFDKAIKLMRTGIAKDVFDIMHLCGYYDQAHFIKEFRKYTGLSPGRFIKITHGDYYLDRPFIIKSQRDASE